MYCELKSGFRGKGKYSLRPWDFFNIMPFLHNAFLNCGTGFSIVFLAGGRPAQFRAVRGEEMINLLPDSGIDQPINQGPPHFLISIF
ncbi:hypothetical protein EO98_01440 [Methanosarcina sp. 2.H.T.1A.6]|nr:hypothetical protein EO94_10890 [Methanosarcina sp. 2.H.T.1A.3]KKG18832.1 hypothetical protein EO97_19240 [Methanosarcina sp. 2.H.T.1A.15]KKG21060.1 hypothetical protein EO98_01440 [Methanosarcina sp. 2.H.T.1A.6]KKG23806.1 hypothetical protein EO96_07150 [Methanosarcina sp. 2.H.T.1A.8]